MTGSIPALSRGASCAVVAEVRFGLGIPVGTHPMPQWIQSADAIAAVTRTAAASGFDHVFVTDHPAPPRRWLVGGGHDTFDPFVALTAVALADPEIGLLTNLVPLAYRHPLVLAKAAASLDTLAGGRLTLGVGVGYLRSEFAALDVPFDERNTRFDAALHALGRLWADGSVEVMAGGDRVDEVVPRPAAPRGRIPIWIGGNAARTRQRVVDHAQGWMPMPNPAAYARTVRSPSLEGPDDLAVMLRDLWRRANQAERSEPIEIVFVVGEGGNPATRDFQPSEHLDALGAYAELGVTGNNVTIDGRDLSETLDRVAAYGATVIEAFAQLGE